MANQQKLKRVLEDWFQHQMKSDLQKTLIEDWDDFGPSAPKKQEKLVHCIQHLKKSAHVPSWLKDQLNEQIMHGIITRIHPDNYERIKLFYYILRHHPWFIQLSQGETTKAFEKTTGVYLDQHACHSFIRQYVDETSQLSALAGYMLYHAICCNYFDASVIPALRPLAKKNNSEFKSFLQEVIDGLEQVEVKRDDLRLFMRFYSYQKDRPHPIFAAIMSHHKEEDDQLRHWKKHSPILKHSIKALEQPVAVIEHETPSQTVHTPYINLEASPDELPLDYMDRLANHIENTKVAHNCSPRVLTLFYDQANIYLEIQYELLQSDITLAKINALKKEYQAWSCYVFLPCLISALLSLTQFGLLPLSVLTVCCTTLAVTAAVWANYLSLHQDKLEELYNPSYTNTLILDSITLFCLALAYLSAIYFSLPVLPMLSLALTCMPLLAQTILLKKVFETLDAQPLPACDEIQHILNHHNLTSIYRIDATQHALNFISQETPHEASNAITT